MKKRERTFVLKLYHPSRSFTFVLIVDVLDIINPVIIVGPISLRKFRNCIGILIKIEQLTKSLP